MNREIEFRGKCVDNGEWVYGYYMLWDKSTYIIVDKQFYEVIPETVGQFTGLYDKNGNKIFEGDILADERGNIITCLFEIQDSNSLFKFIDKKSPTKMYCNISMFFEVIGNIHEEGN